MRATCFFILLFASIGYGQVVRMTKVSPTYNVEVRHAECSTDDKCGPLTILLFRKGSLSVFQTLAAGSIPKADLADCVQFVDLNFDGIRDLAVFDGFEGPGGYATLAQRIYLYSKRAKRFEFNASLSELSHRENLVFELDRKNLLIYTHARPGGGVFQYRGYRFVKDKPVMMYEVIDDSTFKGGTRTKTTTRKLVNGRWKTRTQIYKGPLN